MSQNFGSKVGFRHEAVSESGLNSSGFGAKPFGRSDEGSNFGGGPGDSFGKG